MRRLYCLLTILIHWVLLKTLENLNSYRFLKKDFSSTFILTRISYINMLFLLQKFQKKYFEKKVKNTFFKKFRKTINNNLNNNLCLFSLTFSHWSLKLWYPSALLIVGLVSFWSLVPFLVSSFFRSVSFVFF